MKHSKVGARYKVVSVNDNPNHVFIVDVGPWHTHPTITNDVENVVAKLLKLGTLKPGQRLFYYDSEQRCDEILIEEGRFAGFAAGIAGKVPQEEKPVNCIVCKRPLENAPGIGLYCPNDSCERVDDQRPAKFQASPAGAEGPSPKRIVHTRLCAIYGSATSIAAQSIVSDLQDAGFIHREPLEGSDAPIPAHWDSLIEHIADALWHKSKLPKEECTARARSSIRCLLAPGTPQAGAEGPGWIGVDFDGTLAHYEDWQGHEFEKIGPPIALMMERIRQWISEGRRVKIFTARAGIPEQIPAVRQWLEVHGIGQLEITNIKDRFMYQLWDDRAIRVEINTGREIKDEFYTERKSEPIEFAELDGTLRRISWEKGDESVGAPSGYVADDEPPKPQAGAEGVRETERIGNPELRDALRQLVEDIETDGGIETGDWPEFARAKQVLSQPSPSDRATDDSQTEISKLRARVLYLEGQINTPEILEFGKAVTLEAAHQRERWGAEHDAGKTDADWFWLIGYLAGKALHNPLEPGEDAQEKQLHRIITAAAACANWHSARLGGAGKIMRPGTPNPPGESGQEGT